VAEQLAGGSSAGLVLGRIWPVELFKEQLIYEQSAARTVREQEEKRWCDWSCQPVKIEQLDTETAASAGDLWLADAAKGVKSERNQPFGRMGIGRMIKRAGEAASELASVCSAFASSINLPNINTACEYLLDAQGCFV
jgi:hypothetical protein